MSKLPFAEKGEGSRGELYKDHTYSPTPYESEAELIYLHHTDGAITEILHTTPSDPVSDQVLLMVPGFITILDSWEIFLQGVKDKFEIYYWESREKGTFHPPAGKLKREYFKETRFEQDLVEVVTALELANKDYILAGSSFGGTIIIDVLSKHLLKPSTAILIGANIHFHIPFPGNFLIHIVPASMIGLFKPFMRWYLRNFEVDRESDEKQYQKYVKAIELANFKFIKHTVLNYHQHPQEEILSLIEVPTIVVGAELDKMHTIEETEFTTNQIPQGEMISFETNRETHSKPFIEYFVNRFSWD